LTISRYLLILRRIMPRPSVATRFAVASTRLWTACYTLQLPGDIAAARRNEVEADLWEAARDLPFWQLMTRLVAGIPDDLAWRAAQQTVRPELTWTAFTTAGVMMTAALWTAVTLGAAQAPPPPPPPPAPTFRVAPPPPPPPPPPQPAVKSDRLALLHEAYHHASRLDYAVDSAEHQRRAASAVAVYDRLITSNQRDVLARWNRAMVLTSIGRLEPAIIDLRAVQRSQPRFPELERSLGTLLTLRALQANRAVRKEFAASGAGQSWVEDAETRSRLTATLGSTIAEAVELLEEARVANPQSAEAAVALNLALRVRSGFAETAEASGRDVAAADALVREAETLRPARAAAQGPRALDPNAAPPPLPPPALPPPPPK
jgi:hypothetical protein